MRKLKDLKHDPRNPRKISDPQLFMLGKSLDEFGDLSGFVYNVMLDRFVGGHQRSRVLPPDSEIIITEKFGRPTEKGTTAVGYVKMPNGERAAYREVSWPEARHLAASVAANKGGGQFDQPKLAEVICRLDELNFDLDLTCFDANEVANVVAPTGLPPKPPDPDLDKKANEEQVLTCPHCGGKFAR